MAENDVTSVSVNVNTAEQDMQEYRDTCARLGVSERDGLIFRVPMRDGKGKVVKTHILTARDLDLAISARPFACFVGKPANKVSKFTNNARTWALVNTMTSTPADAKIVWTVQSQMRVYSLTWAQYTAAQRWLHSLTHGGATEKDMLDAASTKWAATVEYQPKPKDANGQTQTSANDRMAKFANAPKPRAVTAKK